MKDMFYRAFRTFFQTAVGYIVTNIAIIFNSGEIENTELIKTALIGVVISSISAGLSAVMNIPKNKDGGNDE